MNWLIDTYSLRPVNLLQGIFVFGCVFSVTLLWSRPRFRGLSMLLVLEAVLMGFNFSEETGLFAQHYLITPVFSLATGPAFYLFIHHLVMPEHQWRWRHLAHGLPCVLALPFTGYTQSVLAVGSVSLLIYGGYSYWLLREYHRAAAALLSDTVSVQLRWIVVVMIVFAILGLTDLIRLNLQPFLAYDLRNIWYFFHQLSVFVLLMWMVSRALQQPELFDQLTYFEQHIVNGEESVDARVDEAVFGHVDQQVKQHCWYLQPKLSLADLSAHLGLGVKDLSGAINQGAQCNFADYINGLRVDAFKQALAEQSDMRPNMLQLALSVGFNSKSAFYDAFRRVEGQTPSQYWAAQHR